MNFGIKLWSTNTELFAEAVSRFRNKEFDYLELSFIHDKPTDTSILKGIPMIIHAPTFNQNVRFSSDSFEKNKQIVSDTLEFAKNLEAKGVIIHPDTGKKENFIRLLKEFRDQPIIIENMPKKALDGNDCIGYTFEDMKEFLAVGNFRLCFDFGHAIKSAISQKLDYRLYLEKYALMHPKILHICDGFLSTEKDEHLSLGKGEYDLKLLARITKQSKAEMITFEVPKEDGLNNDISCLNQFKSLIQSFK